LFVLTVERTTRNRGPLRLWNVAQELQQFAGNLSKRRGVIRLDVTDQQRGRMGREFQPTGLNAFKTTLSLLAKVS
jgi:hypothetical protein